MLYGGGTQAEFPKVLVENGWILPIFVGYLAVVLLAMVLIAGVIGEDGESNAIERTVTESHLVAPLLVLVFLVPLCLVLPFAVFLKAVAACALILGSVFAVVGVMVLADRFTTDWDCGNAFEIMSMRVWLLLLLPATAAFIWLGVLFPRIGGVAEQGPLIQIAAIPFQEGESSRRWLQSMRGFTPLHVVASVVPFLASAWLAFVSSTLVLILTGSVGLTRVVALIVFIGASVGAVLGFVSGS